MLDNPTNCDSIDSMRTTRKAFIVRMELKDYDILLRAFGKHIKVHGFWNKVSGKRNSFNKWVTERITGGGQSNRKQ